MGPQGTPERHAAGHTGGTLTGAKQQLPLGAANPESAHNTERTTAQEQMPSNDSCRLHGRVRACYADPGPAGCGPATVRMHECAPGGYPAPAGYEQLPSGWTSARPAAYPAPAGYVTAAVRMDKCAPGGSPAHAGYEQPPSGWTGALPAATPRTRNSEHATHSTKHRATTLLNRSQVAQDTAHPTQRTGRAHW